MYKMLIVEDERWEREGLVELLDWSAMGISSIRTACDGVEGLDTALDWQPDIVVTDIGMPGMNGIEMARRIKERLPEVRIVVLTGYDHFYFARDAIRFGAVDYVLKPIEEDVVLDTMRNVVQGCDEDRRRRNEDILLHEQVRHGRRAIIRGLLAEAIGGRADRWSEVEQRLCASEELAGEAYALWAAALPAAVRSESPSIDGGLEQTLGRACLAMPIEGDDAGGYAIVMIVPVDKDDAAGGASLAEALLLRLNQESGDAPAAAQTLIALGGCAVDGAGMAASCKQALNALRFGVFADRQGLIRAEAADAAKAAFAEHADEVARSGQALAAELRLHAAALDEAKAAQALAALFELFALYPGAGQAYIGSLLESIVNELSLLDDRLAEGKAERLEMLRSFRRLSDLRRPMETVVASAIERLRGRRAHKDDYIVGKVIALIETRYGSTELNLTRAAEEVFLSPNHLGMLFKKATGRSLNDYLLEYRMNRAEELLRTTKKKVAVVAEQVGIPNTSYFGSLFKQKYGMTPGEYQELAQRR